MFFRLTAIDGLSLPCRVLVTGYQYEVIHGGLLLERASQPVTGGVKSDGYSILRLFGVPSRVGDDGLIVASSEPYRLSSDHRLEIARRGQDSDKGARFRGELVGDTVELRAEAGGGFLPPGTHLSLVAAPGDPITDVWANTFDFGPPAFHPVEPWRQNDPAVQAEIRRAVASAEPERLRAVQQRLESAWRAPA